MASGFAGLPFKLDSFYTYNVRTDSMRPTRCIGLSVTIGYGC